MRRAPLLVWEPNTIACAPFGVQAVICPALRHYRPGSSRKTLRSGADEAREIRRATAGSAASARPTSHRPAAAPATGSPISPPAGFTLGPDSNRRVGRDVRQGRRHRGHDTVAIWPPVEKTETARGLSEDGNRNEHPFLAIFAAVGNRRWAAFLARMRFSTRWACAALGATANLVPADRRNGAALRPGHPQKLAVQGTQTPPTHTSTSPPQHVPVPGPPVQGSPSLPQL
jgi:hypothetical protein